MKYNSLVIKDKVYRSVIDIERLLIKNYFHWVVDAEIENAKIEIKNNTLIWYSGTWYAGTWEFGIWVDGIWVSGLWKNGIWEGGQWQSGNFKSGIDKTGKVLEK